MDLARLLRVGGLVAGPAAALAFVTLVVAMATVGEDQLETSPLAVASSALLLVAAIGIAATAVGALARLRGEGGRPAGPAVASVGSALVVGGVWASLFVMHPLAAEAPEVLETEIAGIVVGYIASYLVFAVGWAWTGVALLRSGLLPTWLGVLVTVAGVLAFVPSPEPVRLLLIGIAAALVAPRLSAPVPVREPSPAPA
jgi:hypothetical protein